MAESEFQFWIATSSNLVRVSKLERISQVSINLQLNNAGTVSMVIDRTELFAANIIPLTNCILVYRNGSLVWSGPIWNIEEAYSGENQKINITAIGWFELLNHRVIRSTPGYSLGTSGITFTNATFESALSGWTATNGAAARDTTVFRSGAGSLRLSENIATGLWTGYTLESSMQANALGSTPTAGKRYKLNFYARARRDARFYGARAPYVEVLESGTRVGYTELTNLFNSGSHTVNGSTVTEDTWTTKASFLANTVEWASSGVAPTFRFAWDVNPSQFYQFDGTGTGYWVDGFGDVRTNGSQVIFTTDGAGQCGAAMNGLQGDLDPGKSYTCAVTFWSGTGGSGTFKIYDSTGASLGTSSDLNTLPTATWQTTSFTFTPNTNVPLGFSTFPVYPYSGYDALYIESIIIKETSTDTDNLLNIDDVTLQEYTGDGIYSNQDAGAIASALLSKANSDGATKIVTGSVQTTQPRTKTYQQFSNVGKEIKALSEIEAGYDFLVDPTTRALNIYNRTNATNFPSAPAGGQAGVGGLTYSADRTSSLRFDYGTGKDNLSAITRRKDSSTVVNRMNVKGKYALGFAQDTTSQSTYGIFEDLVSLPDVIDASTSILPFYANAEVAFRKNPKITYDISVKPGDNSPKLFIDFNIGDRGMINVASSIFVDGAQVNQAIRIFGVQVSIDAEGNERISGLQLVA